MKRFTKDFRNSLQSHKIYVLHEMKLFQESSGAGSGRFPVDTSRVSGRRTEVDNYWIFRQVSPC